MAVGGHAYVDGGHASQTATHFAVSPPMESEVKTEPTTYEAELSVARHPSYSQPSTVDPSAVYNNQHYGHGQGYDAASQYQHQHQAQHQPQQQVQQQTYSGYANMSGVTHNSQHTFHPSNHPDYAYHQQGYQQPQQQPMLPPSNDYKRPQPTYGLYSPQHYHEQQQLALKAPSEAYKEYEEYEEYKDYEEYEEYDEPLMRDVEEDELMLNRECVPAAPGGRNTATPDQAGTQGTSGGMASAREAGYDHHVKGFQVSCSRYNRSGD